MSVFKKSLFTTTPTGESQQSQGELKVTTTGQYGMSLLLPANSWQIIIQSLTTANERLQNQVNSLIQGDKPVTKAQKNVKERAIRITNNHNQVKQPSLRVQRQGHKLLRREGAKTISKIISTCPCQVTQLSPCNGRREMFTQAVSTQDQRRETAPGTESTNSKNKCTTSASTQTQNVLSGVSNFSVERVSASSSRCQRNCPGVSRFTQTDPEQQDRAVNTKLKQRKSPTPTFARNNEQSAIHSNLVAGVNSGPAADGFEGQQIQSEPETQVKSVESVNLRPFQGQSKHVVSTRQHEMRQCFYCHQSGHELKNCSLYQQKKDRRKGSNSKQGVRFSRTNNKTVGWKEEQKNDQYIMTRSTTERTLCTQKSNVGIVSAVEKGVHNTQHTNHSLLPAGKTSVHTAQRTSDSLLPAVKNSVHTTQQTNVSMLAAAKDKVTTISESKAPTKMTEVRGSSSILSLSSSSINIQPVKTPETSARLKRSTASQSEEQSVQSNQSTGTETVKTVECPPTLQETVPSKFAVPTDSDQALSYAQTVIDKLISRNEISVPEQKHTDCVYCHHAPHWVSECRIMIEDSEYILKEDNACSFCAREHDMKTCKWIALLDIVRSLSAEHQEKVVAWCPFLKTTDDTDNKYHFFEFSWQKLEPVITVMNPALFELNPVPA
ncbi:hypothetical protein BsWGS_03835 [Bradybaena similaris]